MSKDHTKAALLWGHVVWYFGRQGDRARRLFPARLLGVSFVPGPTALPAKSEGNQMTLSAISRYRGGAIDEVEPLAQTLKAIYLKYGVSYRLSRFQDGPNQGDWLVIVTYADATAYEKAQSLFAEDAELQQVFIKIAKFATRISREMVVDLAL